MRALLGDLIEQAADLLPMQGPITVFVAQNTLQALEDMPFDTAVRKGLRTFGCEPYMPEARYRDALERGRIRFEELASVLDDELGEQGAAPVPPAGSRRDLRLAMLQYPLRSGTPLELRWFVEETDALRRVRPDVASASRLQFIAETRRWVLRDLRGVSGQPRPDHPRWLPPLLHRLGEKQIESWEPATWEEFTLHALWAVCQEGVQNSPESQPAAGSSRALRHRDCLLRITGVDTDLLVHELLIPICAVFLDQGLANWPLPARDHGLFAAFCALYRKPAGPPDEWLKGLASACARLADRGISPIDCIRESLELLGVPPAEWGEYLTSSLVALRGWAGMIHQVETRGDRVARPIPSGSLIEFLAVRLLLERHALSCTAASELDYHGPLDGLREEACRRWDARECRTSEEERAFLVFQLAQVLGWAPNLLARLDRPGWIALEAEIAAFSSLERRRIFHSAFERRFLVQTLDALASVPAPPTAHSGTQTRTRPSFQVVTCLDEREESFRRHIEEIDPAVETFGVAGFFSVAMYYKGAADAHFVPLCPVVIRPRHWVEEQVGDTYQETHRRRAWARRMIGAVTHRFHLGSRSFAAGAVLSGSMGLFASIPLVARILFPRLSGQLRGLLGRAVQAPPATHLRLERPADTPPGPEANHLGFSVTEMSDVAERLLRDLGMVQHFARLVLLLGHGSESQNNPHKAAYDCGACGGGQGGPNARAAARILNDSRVRAILAGRGLRIPEDTQFVGGLHNTCNDAVTFFDTKYLPPSHQDDFASVVRVIETACDRNAHERCRRFYSARLTLSPEEARQHVEGRSEDMAQTRPEMGHATNAICVIGRRERTRGLFLDRRAFLTSYDPTGDDARGTILTRILQAAVPVCSGINLAYFFSHVDPGGWGAGSKLPHNIASLLGVMDGAASDLRTGLPWQQVEIHEPIRILFAIEADPDLVLEILGRHEGMNRVFRNGWSHLAILPPTGGVLVYRDGAFFPYQPETASLPTVPSSIDWYRGWRDHLEFAQIGPSPSQSTGGSR